MPLTRSGKKVLKKFQSRYGSKAGKSYFYAKANKDPSWASSVHGPAPQKRKAKLTIRKVRS